MEPALEEKAKRCAEWISRSRRIAVLSGAGMSTAAGIPDFRGPNGIYNSLGIDNPERVFEISTFRRDPRLFYTFGRALLERIRDVEPTFSHRFFAALERRGQVAGIITQNIDALHQRAGSRKVFEIHGGIWDTYCTSCHKRFDYEQAIKKILSEDIPRCDECSGVLKPDVVFFGEPVKALRECQELAVTADLFFIIGSSLTVTPAALLPSLTRAPIIVVHRGEISAAYLLQERIELFADSDIDAFFRSVNEFISIL